MHLIVATPDPARPDITIYDYGNGIYKIIRFKSTAPKIFVDPQKNNHYDYKLDSSLSRARKTILELALCNDWKFFCTFTLDPVKGDRQDLNTWHKKFTQWLRDQRKDFKRKNLDISLRFVLIPELHSDGKTWHMHGLFSDISPVLVSFRSLSSAGDPIPQKLLDGDYLNWPVYQKKFGFCSFGLIRNPVAAGFYVTKYITKELSKVAIDVGCSLYYPSRPLKRAVKHGDIYGYSSSFDKYLTNHYDFCDTGMTHVKDGCDWSFALEYMDFNIFDKLDLSDPDLFPDVVSYVDAVQMSFDQIL